MRRMCLALLTLLLAGVVQVSHASNNPFKKDKAYHFDSDVAWYKKDDMAVKSGRVRNRSEMLYFHLNMSEKQMKLRLSKNNPSGDLLNSRNLQNLTVKDIRLDGRRLPVFQWCLDNQERPSRYLKQYALVPGDTCINADGDVIIQLDKKTHQLLKQAKQIKFVLEPFSREETVNFDLQGYADILAQIRPPAPIKRAVKSLVVQKSKAKSVAVKPRVNKPAPIVAVKKIKICLAKAPKKFKSQIKAISYPCDNRVKKAKAIESVAAKVTIEKDKQVKIAKLEAEKKLRLEAKQIVKEEDLRRSEEWAIKQKARWVSRCQKHWVKGVSPCFCRKYISEAPVGVKDTCKK